MEPCSEPRIWPGTSGISLHSFSPVKDHPCHVKQAGRYVTAYLKGDYYDAAHTYQEMLAFMRENALSSGEFAYKEAVLDEIAVQDAGEYITRISIRIDES